MGQIKIQSLVKEALIVQYARPISDDPVIRISEGQPCPMFSWYSKY